MKSPYHFILTGAALIAAACPLAAHAQSQNTAAPARSTASAQPATTAIGKVGLVDVGHIFTHYKKLKDRRDALQKEMESRDGNLKKYQEQMSAITEQLKSGTIAKGSEQWSELESRLTEINANGQAEMSNLRREFARKEVQMYKEVYDEVAYMVSRYAEARNYSLILRYQREPEDSDATVEDPNQVMSRVNQLVVYHKDTDDITKEILTYMNQQYDRAQQAAGGGAPAAPTRQ